jgi:predicted RNase H-like HicB family nuclease
MSPGKRRSVRGVAHERRASQRVLCIIRINGYFSVRYTIILVQEADGGYLATVPALPGCVSQGTRDEVMRNIREAADLYIEDCIASGDPVPNEAGREYFELKTGTHQ